MELSKTARGCLSVYSLPLYPLLHYFVCLAIWFLFVIRSWCDDGGGGDSDEYILTLDVSDDR